jgi:ribonuclease VapC
VVIDSSAILAIMLGEPEAQPLAMAIANDPRRLISAFSQPEASVVIEARKGEVGGRELDLLLHRAQVQVIDLNAEQVDLARQAWRNYGKGRHPAGLNIGDCCAYALAKYAGEPLLFKGDDFSKTDIPITPWRSD